MHAALHEAVRFDRLERHLLLEGKAEVAACHASTERLLQP